MDIGTVWNWVRTAFKRGVSELFLVTAAEAKTAAAAAMEPWTTRGTVPPPIQGLRELYAIFASILYHAPSFRASQALLTEQWEVRSSKNRRACKFLTRAN